MKHRLNDLANVLHRPVETAAETRPAAGHWPDVRSPRRKPSASDPQATLKDTRSNGCIQAIKGTIGLAI